ncbi:MAG: Ig-like domain-containing protein [Candidatus Thermoplasmatota archaeon]|nr:Ig-like domain-containing protein [Candidatus Thermoplasmatota archaeon]
MKCIPVILAMLLLAGALAPGLVTSQDSELILRVAMQDDMKGTNPLTVNDVWSNMVLQWIYEYPIMVDYDSQEIMPYIAIGTANLSGKVDSWDDCSIGNFGYSPKNTWANASFQEAIVFYDFTNVTWHDGEPMTVRDIMFSFHAAGMVPEWSSSMKPLKNNAGTSGSNYSVTSWLHIYNVWEQGNKAALRFVLQEPYSNFFTNTISIMLLPYHIWGSTISGQNVDVAKIWYDPGYNISAPDSWKISAAQGYENNPPIGSGIFQFGYWVKGQMSKINAYRAHFYSLSYIYRHEIEERFLNQKVKQPNIDAITFKIYKTAETAVLALKAGDIDYISWSIPPSLIQELVIEPSVALIQSAEQGFFYLGYNMRRQSFGYNETGQDVGNPLRKAISYCIDKNRIVQRLLLNLGIAGDGPVSSISPWYNKTIPRHPFDPQEAKIILADAGYKVNASGILLSGADAIAAANDMNFWVNPNVSQIGRGPGGQIEILTPEANYDPIRYQAGQMIASQLRLIGLNARSVPWDFGIIINHLQNRDFDIYILGCTIGTDPAEYLHSIFDYDFTDLGGYSPTNTNNYPGYQNQSFYNLIDLARRTGNFTEKKQAIYEAQAAICYDLPIDVLYFRTNIMAYTSDRFIGWITQGGGIFNRASIVNLRGLNLYQLHARFDEPRSAIYSNSTMPISVLATDDSGAPMQDVSICLNASIGKLAQGTGQTNVSGVFSTTFTAPYVPPTPENIINGSLALIQITSAITDAWEYSPAPPRYLLVTVYPEEAKFISLSIRADPDIIEDLGADGLTPGFTYVDVDITDQDGNPVPGATVNLSSSSGALDISPFEMLADQDGKARFTVTAANLMINDGSISEFVLTAQAIIVGSDTILRSQNHITVQVLDAVHPSIPEQPIPSTGPVTFVVVALLAAIAYVAMNRRKRR